MTSEEKTTLKYAPAKARRPLWRYLIAGALNAGVLIANPLLEGTYLVLPLLAFQALACLPMTLIAIFLPRRSGVHRWGWALVVTILFIAGVLLNIYTVSGYTD